MKGFEKDLKGWAGALLDGPQMTLIKEVYADFSIREKLLEAKVD